MKKSILICFICIINISYSQNKKNQIKFDKTISKYIEYTWNDSKEKLNSNFKSFSKSTSFLRELKKKKGNVLMDYYMVNPSNNILVANYLNTQLKWNSSEPEFLMLSNKKVIKKALKKLPTRYELLTFYYQTIFIDISNKNKTIDLSMIDIDFEKLKLNDNTERAIVFLSAMRFIGKQVTSYAQTKFPDNCFRVKTYVKNMPKFNGKSFYEYELPEFDDFIVEIDKRLPKSSFKERFLPNFYEAKLSFERCIE
ncbi:hypothetical protein [Psychroserpens sp.]